MTTSDKTRTPAERFHGLASAPRSERMPERPGEQLHEQCPDANAITAYLDGRLTESQKKAVVGHLLSCERCYFALTEGVAPKVSPVVWDDVPTLVPAISVLRHMSRRVVKWSLTLVSARHEPRTPALEDIGDQKDS